MNDLAKALELLKDTITNSKRHPDYNRVTSLAEMYQKLFTGENIDTLLKKFAKREDEAMFQQRKDLYQSVMPSVSNNLSKVFIKPLRSNRVYSSVDYESNGDKAKAEVTDRMKNFWQGESESGVDAYLRARWFDLVRLDPNAFIAVEFDAFDSNIEKAKPYPVEFSSTEAINYVFKNGILDWLIVETKILYKQKDGDKFKLIEGSRFTMYLENDAVVFIEVDEKDRITDIPDPVFEVIEPKGKKRVFVVQYFQPKSKQVPAMRVGYETDPVTKGRTCVSIFHSAVPFFKKELKAGSELDISMAMHAFPQKIQYAKRCEGDREKSLPCKEGKTPNGHTCKICNGTGMSPVHTTGQDIILVPFPKPGEQVTDLDKLLAYKSPDIELIKFQDEYVDRLTEKARKAVFGGTTMVQKTGLKTATEADYAMDDTYDTLHPFAAKYSAMWLFAVKLIAIYTDNDQGIKLYHHFPNDFKMKTLQQLYAERKEAKDAGLPQQILDAIDSDIQEILYSDDQDTLTKIKIKSRFSPFSGKSTEEIQTILLQGKTTRFYETLYTHFDIVFDNIDSELGDSFYLLPFDKQKNEVSKRVDELIKAMDKERTSKMPIPIEADQLN